MTIGTVMLLECLDSKAPCPFITCVIWFIASMLWISTNVSSCVNIRVIKITTYSTGVRISLHMYIITGPTEADMRYLWRDKIPTDFFCILSLYVDNCVIANCGYKSVTVNYDALFLNLNNNLLLYIYIKKTLCHVTFNTGPVTAHRFYDQKPCSATLGCKVISSLGYGFWNPTTHVIVMAKRHYISWVVIRSARRGIDGLVRVCGNSSALAIELLQSCTKPSISRGDLWPRRNNLEGFLRFRTVVW